jgi:Redoxin
VLFRFIAWILVFVAGSLTASASRSFPTIFEGQNVGSPEPRISKVDAVGKKGVAVVFLSARCPCSESHEDPLAKLAQSHPDINFVGIHSNSDESESEARAHFSKVFPALPFPVLQDEGGKWVDRFAANKTPHVFLLDPQGTLVYQGGVDDTHKAKNATKHYLRAALDAMVSGKQPEVTEAKAVGCFIKR